MTKKYKQLYLLFTIIGIIITTVPVIVYAGISFGVGTTSEKATLALGFIVALVFALISVLRRVQCKSVLWILLLAIAIVLVEIKPLLIFMACGNILDETICAPLANYYKSKFKINKEIDLRV